MKQSEMIFGMRAVVEAIRSGTEIDKILIRRDLSQDTYRVLKETLGDVYVPIIRVPIMKLDRLTRKNHQGVIAFISSVSYHRLDQIIPFVYESGRDPFIMVLDGVTDVRNFGAIARTAECANVDAIVIPSRGSVSVSGDAVKASAGALLTLPICRETSIRDALQYLRQSGIRLVGADEKSPYRYTDADLRGPIALILGAEGEGLSSDSTQMLDQGISIPVLGAIESLNVSVAAGILTYEVLRQRRQ